jgi:outer membrane protein assembly factor BamE (lipoprotein component of BamABCDE complex)
MRAMSIASLVGAAAIAVCACAPVENQRGYVPDMEAIAGIQVGMDTKDTVSMKLGNPSTQATFGNDTWYYISAHVEQNAFFAPRATERTCRSGIHGRRQGFSVTNTRLPTAAWSISRHGTPSRGRTLTMDPTADQRGAGQPRPAGSGPERTADQIRSRDRACRANGSWFASAFALRASADTSRARRPVPTSGSVR